MNVTDIGRMGILDIVVFGKEEETDARKLHLAVFTGEIDEAGKPLLIHANSIEKQVSVWPLEKFFSHPKYQRIYRIKRWRGF